MVGAPHGSFNSRVSERFVKKIIHSNNMLKGLLSVFHNIGVSFFILVFPDFGPVEECVLALTEEILPYIRPIRS